MSTSYQNLLSSDGTSQIVPTKGQSVSDALTITAIPPKSGKLKDYQVYYNDIDSNSKFFRIRKVPSILTSGKNYFLIAGTDLLQPTTNVAVEVLDVNGNNLAVEIPNILINGVERAVVIIVYPEDYYGDCIITVLGEAIDVPRNWKGVYNVKWQTKVICNPSIDNEDDAIFANNPTITYNEIYDTNGSITKLIVDKTVYNQGLIYTKVAGEKLSPLMQYEIHLKDGLPLIKNNLFDSLENWYTGSSYVDSAYVSSNKLYISQSYGLFGITMGVTQSLSIIKNKVYTVSASFIGTESDLGGSVASLSISSGSNVFLYLYSTSSSDVILSGKFSSSVDISASIELGGQAFAIQTVWSDINVIDDISSGFTKEMEGGLLEVEASDLMIYPNNSYYSASKYTTYISKVINNKLAIANNSYQAYNYLTKNYDRVPFVSASYVLSYGKYEYVGNNNIQNSYLNIQFRNLSTVVGSIKYIDLYKNPGNNYIGRYPLLAHNMLKSGSSFSQLSDFTDNWNFIESGTYVSPISTDRTHTVKK